MTAFGGGFKQIRNIHPYVLASIGDIGIPTEFFFRGAVTLSSGEFFNLVSPKSASNQFEGTSQTNLCVKIETDGSLVVTLSTTNVSLAMHDYLLFAETKSNLTGVAGQISLTTGAGYYSVGIYVGQLATQEAWRIQTIRVPFRDYMRTDDLGGGLLDANTAFGFLAYGGVFRNFFVFPVVSSGQITDFAIIYPPFMNMDGVSWCGSTVAAPNCWRWQ